MPGIKRLSNAVRKYAMKYDSSRLIDDKIKSIASENRKLSIEERRFVDGVTEKILVSEVVPKEKWEIYKEFARKIAEVSRRYNATTLLIAIDAKKAFYEDTYNADPSILDKIVKAIIGQDSLS